MNYYDNNIKGVIDSVLDRQVTSIEFESIWNKAVKNDRKILGIRKTIAIPMIVIISLLTLFSVGFASYTAFRNVDKTDYPFVDDSGLIGRWASVDLVDKIDDFEPGKKSWKEELYLKFLAFIKGGKMLTALQNDILAQTELSWTKGIIVNKYKKTASKYIIKEINGNTYLFFEWKTGDYVFGNRTPPYYVLVKVDSNDYSNYQTRVAKEDKVDYPFVDDPQTRGKWESVDIVRNIDDFKPGEKSWQWEEISILSFQFKDNGAMDIVTTTPRSSKRLEPPTWTKGFVLFKNNKIACKCEIKGMSGATYMFYEWKNGDYIYRGMDPFILVLKKVE